VLVREVRKQLEALASGQTVEASDIEELVAFYRQELEQAENLPATLVEKKTEIRKRHPGALNTLKQLGIEIPEAPKGYTHEEKVYEIVSAFRDRLLEMPSDPKHRWSRLGLAHALRIHGPGSTEMKNHPACK
jgi:hypothetical protein